MKRILLLSAIAILGFASCKKEVTKPKTDVVEYYVYGKNIQVHYKNDSGLLIYKSVENKWSEKFEANTLKYAFIGFILDKDEPSQTIVIQIKINDIIVKEFNQNHIKGILDINDNLNQSLK